MRYFFDVVLGQDRVRDPEGSDLDHFDAATAEAAQIAREFAAEVLSKGEAVRADWTIEVLNEAGQILTTCRLQDVILAVDAAEGNELSTKHSRIPLAFYEYHWKSKTIFEETRSIVQDVRSTFNEIRKQLEQLG